MLATAILGSGKEYNTQNNTQQNINDKNKGIKEKMRKEIFKKYSSAALALGLAATAVLPTTSLLAGKAAAEGEVETPKIIINNVVAGETYNAYKIFDLTHSGNAVAYTIDDEWAAFFSNKGAKYIVNNGCSNTNYATKEACEDAHETWSDLNQIIVGGAIKYMNITEANKANFAQDALEYTSGLTADGSTTPAEGATSAEISGENIKLGYYLVYNGGIKTKGEWTTLAALDSAMPTATVVPKATFPTISKNVDDHHVEVGQHVTFTIEGTVPDTTGYTKYDYIVTDTMTNGLTFDGLDTIEVKIGESTVTGYAKNEVSGGFKLTFDMVEYAAKTGKPIVITYTATVNKEAVLNTSVNTVTLDYSHNPKNTDDHKQTTDTESLYSYEVDVNKYDDKCANNEENSEGKICKLANAKFVLKKKDGEVVYYYQAFANGEKKTLLNNVSETSLVTRVNWTTNKEKATVLVTDNNGSAVFKGVEAGTYYLEETEAPAGYNKLTSDIKVVVTPVTGNSAPAAAVADVPNVTGTELPTTGALGTKIFITLGAITALGAAVVLVANKRMANEEA